jgi:hypothetical protein
MVGSEQGQVYKGKQGIQYATILDSSKIADKIAALGLQAKAAKAKEADDAAKITMDFKPAEVWHYYSAEATKRYEEWAQKGAKLMTGKNISNLWNSTDPEAVNWQLEGARLKQGYANIKQAQDQWGKSMDKVREKGDEYTEDYLKSLEFFPANVSFDQIASGNFNWPQAEFKNPTHIFQRFLTTDLKGFQSELGDRPPKPEEVQTRVVTYFNTPEHENDKKGMQQMFKDLSPQEQQRMQTMAQNLGYNDPAMALAHEMYENRLIQKPANMQLDANKYSEEAALATSQDIKEDVKGVTEERFRKYLADPKYPENAAKSHFTSNQHLLSDEGYMSDLGVDMNLPLEERRKKAITAFSKIIKSNLATERKDSLRREQGADGGFGFTQEEETKSLDNWYADITSDDRVKATQAANWLYGVKIPGIEGAIEKSIVIGAPGSAFGYPDRGKMKALRMEFKDSKSARSAQGEILKLMNDIDVSKMTPGEKAQYEKVKLQLNKGGDENVIIPITEETIQVLKEIHRRSASTKKELYSIGYKQTSDLTTPRITPEATWSGGESQPPAPKGRQGSLNTPGG